MLFCFGSFLIFEMTYVDLFEAIVGPEVYKCMELPAKWIYFIICMHITVELFCFSTSVNIGCLPD